MTINEQVLAEVCSLYESGEQGFVLPASGSAATLLGNGLHMIRTAVAMPYGLRSKATAHAPVVSAAHGLPDGQGRAVQGMQASNSAPPMTGTFAASDPGMLVSSVHSGGRRGSAAPPIAICGSRLCLLIARVPDAGLRAGNHAFLDGCKEGTVSPLFPEGRMPPGRPHFRL